MKKRILINVYLLILSIVLYFLVEDKIVLGILFGSFFAYAIFDRLEEIKERRKTAILQDFLVTLLRAIPYLIMLIALLK
jgi:ABC-type methionine transport system permease subunit